MPERPKTRWTALVLMLPLVWGGVIAGRSLLADVQAEPAKVWLQSVRDAGEAVSDDELRQVWAAIERALEISPADPRNLSELGRLSRGRLEDEDLSAEEILQFGDAAVTQYSAALKQRPTWPWDWGNLALALYEQYQDTSPLLHEAIVNTMRFGASEASLQTLIAEIGIFTWEYLSDDAAAAALLAIDRALERDSDTVLLIGEDEPEAWEPICAGADHRFGRLQSYCETLGFT